MSTLERKKTYKCVCSTGYEKEMSLIKSKTNASGTMYNASTN